MTKHIAYGPSWTRYTFAAWKTFSGMESHSKTNWFTQPAGEASRGKVFYNASKAPLTVDLGDRRYLDLDRQPVAGWLTLPPFASQVLVDDGPAPPALHSISPSLLDIDEAADFTLTAYGVALTPNSVVRWNGSARPTTFIDSGS